MKEFPSKNLEEKIKATKSKTSSQTTKKPMKTSKPPPFEATKRKTTENIGNDSKKKKSDHTGQSHSTNDEECHSSSNQETTEKNQMNSSNKTATSIGPFKLRCFYCEDSSPLSRDPSEIFDHWERSHSNNILLPFLFKIVHRNNETNIKLTNFQLKRCLSLFKNPNTEHDNAENDKNRIEYLQCGECEMKLLESEYFKHIERHANELRAKKEESDPKTRLKSIHSKTKVVLQNGLVLTKHNLSTTDLGDNKELDEFIGKQFNATAEDPDVATSSIPDFEFNAKFVDEMRNVPDPLQKLKCQLPLMNIMSIIGIPSQDNENETMLREIFSKICQQLNISIQIEADVSRIYRVTENVIGVEFNDFKTKEQILYRIRFKYLYTSDILENLPMGQSKQIYCKHFLTRFYRDIQMHLCETRGRGHIHSYKFTERGFAFKKSAHSEDRVILSIEQFKEIINN